MRLANAAMLDTNVISQFPQATPMTYLETLFSQKSWANNELFNALAAIPLDAHVEAVTSAVRTLNHIYVVDRIFQAHLSGQQHKYTATNTNETPALDQLHFSVVEMDAWYLQYVKQIPEDEIKQAIRFRFTDGDTGEMTREEILLHVITHGAYHRGNVGQILKSISMTPPRDLLTKFLHVSQPSRRWV
jgi:uncharacterized damage-inducible protein DinB